MPITVSKINIYPLKSGASISLEHCAIGRKGMVNDRIWMLIDNDGIAITAREFPVLLKIESHPTQAGIIFKISEKNSIELRVPDASQEKTMVNIFSVICPATLVLDKADQWFSEILQTSCRLVYMRPDDLRSVEQKVGGQEGDVVSFADENPLLLITESSLAQLNNRLEDPVSMLNFRPNIVVAGSTAFVEDAWSRVQLGESTYRVAQACKRCNLTTIDPQKAQFRSDGEPLKTLAKFRYDRDKSGVLFGVHLIPENESSEIRIGDDLTVIV